MLFLNSARCDTLNTFPVGLKPAFLSESCVTVTRWSLESDHESLTQPLAIRHSPPGLNTLNLRVFQVRNFKFHFLEFLHHTNLKAAAVRLIFAGEISKNVIKD